MLRLPVDSLIPELRDQLARSSSIVVQASPGSGKTTRIPPALIRESGEILVLEPRRVAAKYAARRVAQELGCELGELVGYQFRFENVSSARTRLRFLTEGMLMRRFLSDPELKAAHTVILDEFHERHLHGDLALAYLRRLQLGSRPDLKIVVMSATLDSEAISRYLGDAPVLKIDAPLHPVELTYLPSPPAKSLDVLVRDAVKTWLEKDTGDVLAFLPGMTDIRRCSEALTETARRSDALIAPLHGELTREEQDLAIEKSPRRKIILATNVAETSLTIEGVRTVIDSGLHRVASYSWWSGVPTLRTRPISRASAIQRAGRAGRTGPGRCIRLYTRGDFDGRAPFQTPEIRRADLTQSVLELKSLGVLDPSALMWFEPPSEQALQSAQTLLERLGALTGPKGPLSEIGRQLVRIPAHPRIGRVLLESSANATALKNAALLGALISEGELQNIDALESLKNGFVPDRVRRLADLLAKAISSRNSPVRELAYALLTGFPDRVARRSSNGMLVFSEGGSARAPEYPLFAQGEYFVLLDVRESQALGQARTSVEVRSAVPIQPDWLLELEPPQVKEVEALSWDSGRKRVQSVEQLRYGQLVLTESNSEPRGRIAASHLLAKEGLGLSLDDWTGATSIHDVLSTLGRVTHPNTPEALESWIARLELLRRIETALPEITSSFLKHFAESALTSCTSLQDARDVDWENALLVLLEEMVPGIRGLLDREVPLQLHLPNGRRASIQYRLGNAPWIESRLQDFFGVRTPPSILRGQLPLTLHLLAPNHRAVQVTTDLPGFWKKTYPEIRKELSRKYPRHSWPEDPSKAEASDSRLKPRN